MTASSTEPATASTAGFDRPTATSSAFPVVAWFAARAAADRLSLQPLKLQALLFLAQGLFAVRTGGRLLMPAQFVADERAPIEPNIHVVLANGWDPRPATDGALSPTIERFLETVWERFGRQPAIELVTRVNALTAFTAALACGIGTPIGNDAIRQSCASLDFPLKDQGAQTARPLRTQDGRLVTARAWEPGRPPPASTPKR
jgi:uncharacterized phage-associated protein